MKLTPIDESWQKRDGQRHELIKSLLEARFIIFGLVLANFVFCFTSVTRLISENPFVEAPRWYFEMAMKQPLFLLLAAICLLVPRRWSYLFAGFFAGTILYENVYRAFNGISYAHDIPIVSVKAMLLWFENMSSFRLINTILAVAIAATAMTRLFRRFGRWSDDATPMERESPTDPHVDYRPNATTAEPR